MMMMMMNCRLDVASTHRQLAQAIDRPALVALINCPLHMNQFVIKILSSSLKTVIRPN